MSCGERPEPLAERGLLRPCPVWSRFAVECPPFPLRATCEPPAIAGKGGARLGAGRAGSGQMSELSIRAPRGAAGARSGHALRDPPAPARGAVAELPVRDGGPPGSSRARGRRGAIRPRSGEAARSSARGRSGTAPSDGGPSRLTPRAGPFGPTACQPAQKRPDARRDAAPREQALHAALQPYRLWRICGLPSPAPRAANHGRS